MKNAGLKNELWAHGPSYVVAFISILRIDTVLKSDRILVMEQGLVKEFAPPQELLENHDSFFYFLYRHAAQRSC